MSISNNQNKAVVSTRIGDDELRAQAVELYDDWRRLGAFSRIVRSCAWVIVMVSAIAATIYFSVRSSDFSEFNAILMAVVCVVAISVGVCGLLVLLLKPFFWHNRKKAKQVHEQLTQTEGAMLSAILLSNQQSVSDYVCLQSSVENRDGGEFSAENVFNTYRATTCDICNNYVYMRELQMSQARWGEWCWVTSAGFVAVIAGAIAIAITMLLALIFIFFLWMIISLYSGRHTHYTYVDVSDGADVPPPSRVPAFFNFFTACYDRFFAVSKSITEIKKSIKSKAAHQNAILHLFQTKGVSILETINLPYWL